jgi:hypothetical protein
MRRQLSRELGIIFLDNHINVSRVVNVGVWVLLSLLALGETPPVFGLQIFCILLNML